MEKDGGSGDGEEIYTRRQSAAEWNKGHILAIGLSLDALYDWPVDRSAVHGNLCSKASACRSAHP